MSERDDAAYIEHLEAQIRTLEEEVKRLQKEKGLSSASGGMTFNETTGTHEDASKKHFCTKCLLKDDKRIPLKTEPHGWRCLICTKYYADPNRPEQIHYPASDFP
jgi:hypothetical protein